MPHAILFDLDETLIDRTQSIARYAERFQRDFTGYLPPLVGLHARGCYLRR